jgi:hypothetical protein
MADSLAIEAVPHAGSKAGRRTAYYPGDVRLQTEPTGVAPRTQTKEKEKERERENRNCQSSQAMVTHSVS